ncbi:MAG TPA: DNA-processing protein DprA [Candidatus Limnocylindrales bacterium]|nr:DNA-processing protein DprA [Candidatus Limnocylindrales bacterium]
MGTGPEAAAEARFALQLGSEDRDALAVLVSVQGLGPITLDRLLGMIGSPAAVLATANGPNGVRTLVAAGAVPEAPARSMAEAVAEAIVKAGGRRGEILDGIARLGLRILAVGDPDYPARLLAIEIPPAALFVRGNAQILSADHSVAVVGTRRPTEAGRRIAARIGVSLVRAGAVVVSGLAVGIDGATHAAVVTEKGPTIAFIGSGHSRLFPAVHDRLADQIVEAGGAIVSEYAPDTEPTKWTFPRRNRLISGSADAVVIVEAGAKSGALLTGSWALEQGRDCFVVPGSIDAHMSAGCLGFLRDWPGLVRVASGIPQLLEDLGLPPGAAYRAPARPSKPSSSVRPPTPQAVLSGSTPDDRAVGTALLDGAVIVDEIVAVTGLTIGATLGALTRLEAAGHVSGSHGRYRLEGSWAGREPRRLRRAPERASPAA